MPQEEVQNGYKSAGDTELQEENHCCEMRRILPFRKQASVITPWAILSNKLLLLPAGCQEREENHFPLWKYCRNITYKKVQMFGLLISSHYLLKAARAGVFLP